MSVKISVIMPVYNAAEFLEETLDSVLNQTLEEYEVIAVNDGSKDDSLDILNRYAQEYDNLKIIDQKNAGPSAARNAGLDNATGEFIYFPDSDDLLNKNSLELMYERAVEQDADLVIARYDIFNRVSKTKVKDIYKLTNREEIGRYDHDILWTFSLCNKLFRRDVIEENHFRFPPISYSEDGVFALRYVYKAQNITGLPKIVYHYRRVNDSIQESITSTVSKKKVEEYVEAHRLIYEAMVESFLDEYEDYDDIHKLMRDETIVSNYINAFYKKEITILFNQFYKKFWTLDEEIISYVADAIKELMQKVDAKVYYSLCDIHYELNLENLYHSYPEALEDAKVTVLLYGEEQNQENFNNSLINLCGQNLVPFKIIVPSSMREFIDEDLIRNRNIIYVDAVNKTEFWKQQYESCTTPYIIFSDSNFVFAAGTVKEMFITCDTGQYDFITYGIYYASSAKMIPVKFQQKAIDCIQEFRGEHDSNHYEMFMQNKIVSVAFLREQGFEVKEDYASMAQFLYNKGFYIASKKKYMAFQGDIHEYLYDVLDESTEKEIVHENIANISLSDERFDPDMKEVNEVVPPTKAKGYKGTIQRAILSFVNHLPIKNRTFIVSVRKDDELEGNAKALEKYIEGDKVICAKMLPHKQLYKLKMYYYVATSKVIVTDDYLRYLRVFPLKKEQRVVQLWHACGVFKKFGVHGTTLGYKVDRSTHAQYNVACVSSEEIRPVYAEAFHIGMDHVQALGTPRTDAFFDQEGIEKKKAEVYEKHPELKGKKVLLYAPTFRDHDGARNIFNPEIDFDKLSSELRDDQIFVVCPHPVMDNEIVEKEYSNIEVIRDVSTNDIMLVSDLLITDYSSVIFEYALLRKPIVFYCYDRDLYDRGFYLDYNRDLPGEIIEDFDSFVDFLKDESKHVITDKYNTFVEKYMSACDGHSSERIAKLINDYMRG